MFNVSAMGLLGFPLQSRSDFIDNKPYVRTGQKNYDLVPHSVSYTQNMKQSRILDAFSVPLRC